MDQPDQTALYSLIGELGLETFERHKQGKSVYRTAEGESIRYEGEDFPVANPPWPR